MQIANTPMLPFPRRILIGHVTRAVCIECKLRKAELVGPRRHLSLVRPRQIGMFVAKELVDASLPAIGRAFGGRDHTTVLHAMRRIAELAQDDSVLRAKVAAVRARAIALANGEPVEAAPQDPAPEQEPEVVEPAPAPVVAVSKDRTALTVLQALEARRLKRLGWSVFGLARRYQTPVDVVCDAVGERDWRQTAA